MPPTPITTLIFDLDGVLADLCELHRDLYIESFNALARSPGVEGPLLSEEVHAEELEGLSTRSKLRACRALFPAATFDDDAVYDLKQARTVERLATHFFPPRSREALAWARGAGLRLACYTNSIRATLDIVMARLGLADLMEVTQSNEDVPASKPSPVGYTQLMARMGVEPAQALIFEDSAPGLAAARGSGAGVIHVLNSLDITPAFLEAAVRARAPPSPARLRVVVPMAGASAAFEREGFVTPRLFLPTEDGGEDFRPLWRLVVDNVLPRAEPLRAATEVHLVVRAEHAEAIRGAGLPAGVALHVAPPLSEGQACTVLTLRDIINDDTPLVIANADQFVEWDPDLVFRAAAHPSYDGAVCVFYHPVPADLSWSYASVLPSGELGEVAEKRFVGPWATTGHYAWRRGADFVAAAEAMIRDNARVNGAFYVAPAYSYAQRGGAKFRVIPVERFWGLGSPEDYAAFLNSYRPPGSRLLTFEEALARRYARLWCLCASRLPTFNAALRTDASVCQALWVKGDMRACDAALRQLRAALSPWASKFHWFDLPAQGGFHTVVQMSALSMPYVAALQRERRDRDCAAWAAAARGALAALPPFSLALRGCVPTNQGLSLAGVPPADFSPLRAAVLRAAPCFPQAAALRAYNVPLLRWTAPVTAKEYADFLAVAGAFRGSDFGELRAREWGLGELSPSFSPATGTRAIEAWAC
jgi:beta-phosphoglucomutase-like phosphatase (HAD superfamily)